MTGRDTKDGLPVYEVDEMDLAPPEQFELRISEILEPLQAALSQAALDRANARAELRAWQEHAGRLAEQVSALKAALADRSASRDVVRFKDLPPEQVPEDRKAG